MQSITPDQVIFDELAELKDIFAEAGRPDSFGAFLEHPRLSFLNEDDDDDSSNNDDDDNDNDDDADKDKSGDNNDDDDDKDKDKVTVHKNELSELKRLRKEDEERKKKEAKDAARRKKDEGKYEELIKDKDEEVATAQQERDDWKGKYENLLAKQSVTAVARRVGMDDPEDAMLYLDEETKKSGDEKLIEADLKKLRKRKPKLFGDPPRTGGGHNGNGGGPNGKRLLTFDEIKAMSTEQIQKNQKLVDESMAALGQD